MENQTYSEIEQAADYDDAARRYNVVALGNGENPLTWHARPGCFGYLCDDCAVSENCADFTAAFAPRIVTAQALEIAGAFSPRCDF